MSFEATATIGRQGLYVAPADLSGLLRTFGQTLSPSEFERICPARSGYAEDFLRLLGARSVDSVDYSSFEGATILHDMNQPIPDDLHERFTVVLDGGALEHVFNFPVSIRNCMEMVRVGGHYLAITPANNFFGHGFYQFSPELYFTVLSEDNGFALEHMYAFEETANPSWYVVKSPREAGGRVTLTNSHGVYLLIIARRIARKPIFERTPQQSDYVGRWSANGSKAPTSPKASVGRPLPIRLAKALLPTRVRQGIRAALTRTPRPQVGFDPRFFQPFDPIPSRLKNRSLTEERKSR